VKKEAKQYSAEEKAKIALEALKGELTIAQITSKYGEENRMMTAKLLNLEF